MQSLNKGNGMMVWVKKITYSVQIFVFDIRWFHSHHELSSLPFILVLDMVGRIRITPPVND